MSSDSAVDPQVQEPTPPRAPTSAWQRRTAEMRAVGKKLDKKNLDGEERLQLLRQQAELADKREATLSRRLPRDL